MDAIVKDAETQALKLENPKEAEEFKDKYVKFMVNLQGGIELILDQFEDEALPVLRHQYPDRPIQVLNVLGVQKERLRTCIQTIVKTLDPIHSVMFKTVCADYVRAMLDVYVDAGLAADSKMLDKFKELH